MLKLRQKLFIMLILSVTFSVCFTYGCEGGDAYTPASRVYEAGAYTVDVMPMAGEPIAGEPMAGVPVAGVPVTAMPVEIKCGLITPESRETFAQGPLTTLTTSCANAGCHSANSFRQFKLSFTEPITPNGFSPEQVLEGLSAVEGFVILGQGSISQISTRMIDDHAPLIFNDQSPEYLAVVSWIDGLVSCD